MAATPNELPSGDATECNLARVGDVRERQTAWLWPTWVPLDKLAILDGDPGLGKSTLMFDLAARVSKDGVMPDGSQGAAGGVIIANAEDDLEDTIKPRLLAAGADADRLYHISEVGPASARRPLHIPEDTRLLGRLIHDCQARLLIIDPLTAFLAGVDLNRDQDVRKALMPLSRLAHDQACAVMLVRHLNKLLFGKAIYRGAGSIGVIDHARTGLVVAQAPDNETERILAVEKCNISTPPASLRFALESTEGVCRIRWLGAAPFRANDLVDRPPSAEQRARNRTDRACQEYMRRMLKQYSRPAKSVKDECAEAGFSLRTVERAAHNLGVVLTRDYGMYMWALPEDGAKSAS